MGRAEFVDAHTVECGGDRITARHVIVATGASPSAPDVEGLEEAGYLTSTTALELREPPGELIVIGASWVGLELGQLFLHLGSTVTLLQRSMRIASREELETSEAITAVFLEQGARVMASGRPWSPRAPAMSSRPPSMPSSSASRHSRSPRPGTPYLTFAEGFKLAAQAFTRDVSKLSCCAA